MIYNAAKELFLKGMIIFFCGIKYFPHSLLSKEIPKPLPWHSGCFFTACKHFIPLTPTTYTSLKMLHSFMLCLLSCTFLCQVYLEKWQIHFCSVKCREVLINYSSFPCPPHVSSSFPLLAYFCITYVLSLLILTL